MEVIITAILFGLGYFAGTHNEKKHYASIEEREKQLVGLPAVTRGKHLNTADLEGGRMVMGNVVISVDYFKRFLAGLRNIAGGRVTTYETLVDRARREAILRMKEDAGPAGLIANVRIETSAIGRSANSKGAVGSIEALAYGTALYSPKKQ